jgi:hypothetical protein
MTSPSQHVKQRVSKQELWSVDKICEASHENAWFQASAAM